MSLATFVAGIVLAFGLGIFLAAMWFRSRAQPPVMETLARLETQIRELESQRQRALGGLDQQLTSLSRETVALSPALRAPNARGRWGELTLRRVAKLSGGRTLAVDAKVPLSAYLDSESAPDEAQKRAALDRHTQQVMRHVMQLG